jgi:hypothetical protein
MLAKERERHHVVVKAELDAAGIKPAFDRRKVFARFYQRTGSDSGPLNETFGANSNATSGASWVFRSRVQY